MFPSWLDCLWEAQRHTPLPHTCMHLLSPIRSRRKMDNKKAAVMIGLCVGGGSINDVMAVVWIEGKGGVNRSLGISTALTKASWCFCRQHRRAPRRVTFHSRYPLSPATLSVSMSLSLLPSFFFSFLWGGGGTATTPGRTWSLVNKT